MKFVADLHLHSSYSRACSKDLNFPNLSKWAKYKGIDLLSTTDFTHPTWFREIKNNLKEDGSGLFNFVGSDTRGGTKFILGTEVACIYSQGGNLHRIHILLFVPKLEDVSKINEKLANYGTLSSDGRPMLGISAKNLALLVLEINKDAIIIPAHVWTPWFSLYGSNSGFDSLEDCFGETAKYIYAIETGLSSDPAMNWRIEDLDNKSIVSFSDAHSLPKMAREATVFEASEISYELIYKAIAGPAGTTALPKIAFTIEFFPEEGKYHFSGHRNCSIKQSDEETANRGTICPVCKKKLTLGVMHRVNSLAKRETKELGAEIDKEGFVKSKFLTNRPPFVNLVPLQEIIAESLRISSLSEKVRQEYLNLVKHFGSELNVLLKAEISEIVKAASVANIAAGVQKVRERDLVIEPGFDGVYGVVKIWPQGLQKPKIEIQAEGQIDLFDK